MTMYATTHVFRSHMRWGVKPACMLSMHDTLPC